MSFFSKEEEEYILTHYVGTGNVGLAMEMSEVFKREIPARKVKEFKSNHKLNSGLTGRFEKGHVPSNKGRTWDEYMSKEGQARARRTTYKKGDTPMNHKPVGTESLRRKWDGEEYWFVKVAEPNKWRLKQQVEWEKLHGPIPEGKMVTFLDGDINNFDRENLVLIDMVENIYLNKNRMRQGCPEAVQAGINISRIHKKLKEIRNNGNKEHDDRLE